jgi:putative membrane protein
MPIELILFLFAGILAGTITGLTPGIHINLIASIFITSSIILSIPATPLVVFIVAMAITHTFLDFIPAIYLGAPDEDTGLVPLPHHQFLIDGHGHKALILTLIGSTIAIISLIAIVPIHFFFLESAYPFIQKMLGFFLILIMLFLLYDEKETELIILSAMVFFLSGFLGIATLNSTLEEPLLPLLTGLFASSSLITSIKRKTAAPKQSLEKIKIPKKELIKPTISTMVISPICSLFPGLGASQAAVLGSRISGKISKEQFLILLGSINTLVMATSFITFALISKSRTGAANFISQVTNFNEISLVTIIPTIAITSIIAIPLTIHLSKLFAKNIHRISYTKTSLAILIFLTIIILKFSGPFGLAVFTISTILGLACIELGIKRSFLMGCLLVPTIIYYLPF